MDDAERERKIKAKAQSMLVEAVGEAQKHFGSLLKAAKAEQQFAIEQQARWAKELKRLAAAKDNPADPHSNTYASIAFMHEAYAASQRMAELEIAAYEHNLEVVGPQGALGHGTFQVPQESLAYLEQKRRHRVATGRYLVRYNLPGIDAVLRWAQRGQLIKPVSEAQKAEREAVVKKLKAAADASKPLEQHLGKLAEDLARVRDLNLYGRDQFEAWDKLGPEQRQALVKEPRWERYEELLPLLRELPERNATYPAIAELFTPWKAEKVSFTVPTPPRRPAEDAPQGGDQLAVKKGAKSSLSLP